MIKIISVGALALALGACATERDTRMLNGAAIGGAGGAIIGGVASGTAGGAVVGGVAGAAVGALVADATRPHHRHHHCRYHYDMENGRCYR